MLVELKFKSTFLQFYKSHSLRWSSQAECPMRNPLPKVYYTTMVLPRQPRSKIRPAAVVKLSRRHTTCLPGTEGTTDALGRTAKCVRIGMSAGLPNKYCFFLYNKEINEHIGKPRGSIALSIIGFGETGNAIAAVHSY